MPGSPATSTTAPGTMPPPSTRSNSGTPVGRATARRTSTSPIGTAGRSTGRGGGGAHGGRPDLGHAAPRLALAAPPDPLHGLPAALGAAEGRARAGAASRGGGGHGPKVCRPTDTVGDRRAASPSRVLERSPGQPLQHPAPSGGDTTKAPAPLPVRGPRGLRPVSAGDDVELDGRLHLGVEAHQRGVRAGGLDRGPGSRRSSRGRRSPPLRSGGGTTTAPRRCAAAPGRAATCSTWAPCGRRAAHRSSRRTSTAEWLGGGRAGSPMATRSGAMLGP